MIRGITGGFVRPGGESKEEGVGVSRPGPWPKNHKRVIFQGGVFENKFGIFKWVRVEGLQWHR
jgi:hypothetical protein